MKRRFFLLTFIYFAATIPSFAFYPFLRFAIRSTPKRIIKYSRRNKNSTRKNGKRKEEKAEDILDLVDNLSNIYDILDFIHSSKNPTLEGQVLVTPRRGYDAFHLKGVRVTVSPILI